MFVFNTQGLLVNPDDTDNPDNHAILHHDAGTMVSFSVSNAGSAAGTRLVSGKNKTGGELCRKG